MISPVTLILEIGATALAKASTFASTRVFLGACTAGIAPGYFGIFKVVVRGGRTMQEEPSARETRVRPSYDYDLRLLDLLKSLDLFNVDISL